MMVRYFVGVDVGTGSARAALVSEQGAIVCVATEDIKTWNPLPHHYEQSSDNIWAACCACIKKVVKRVKPESIKGIGFDATCSLVCLDKQGGPLSVSTTGNKEQNVILWMDHRATEETDVINAMEHDILKYVGGILSPEMQIPKLRWLKTNLTMQCWNRVGHFFDLPDFLTYKATNSLTRSLCSLVCKWNYEAGREQIKGWSNSFLKLIDMDDLLLNDCKKIGWNVQRPGEPVGNGLSDPVAKELGLIPGTPVGTSLIDAHAGTVGLLGCTAIGVNPDLQSKLALICGTSTCHMALADNPRFIEGIWGPYFGAILPDMWLHEGGQSATGKLVDYIIESHPAAHQIKRKIFKMHIHSYLNNLLSTIAHKENFISPNFLTKDLHILPDFHGNRSPIADPTIKGMISGLTLENGEKNLALMYLATIQSICYGTRHIVESLKANGYNALETVIVSGGLSKNPLFIQTQADVLNLPILIPKENESMLLGSAILGACAANCFTDMRTAMKEMAGGGTLVVPDSRMINYHNSKYKVFLKMYEDQRAYKAIMVSSCSSLLHRRTPSGSPRHVKDSGLDMSQSTTWETEVLNYRQRHSDNISITKSRASGSASIKNLQTSDDSGSTSRRDDSTSDDNPKASRAHSSDKKRTSISPVVEVMQGKDGKSTTTGLRYQEDSSTSTFSKKN